MVNSSSAEIRDAFLAEQENVQQYEKFLRYRVQAWEADVKDLLFYLTYNRSLSLPNELSAMQFNQHFTQAEVENLLKYMDDNYSKIIQTIEAAGLKFSDIEISTGNHHKVDQAQLTSTENEQLLLTPQQAEEFSKTFWRFQNRDQTSEIDDVTSNMIAELGESLKGFINVEQADLGKAALVLLIAASEMNTAGNLVHALNIAKNLRFSLKTLVLDSDINLLRQSFILLVTAFDASVFDLTRVALEKDFFRLVALFGKQEKIVFDALTNSTSMNEFRDETIEQLLKTKYIKDILFLLKEQDESIFSFNNELSFAHLIEVVNRRNVHIHHQGKVDNTYLNKDRQGKVIYNVYNLELGQLAMIDTEYWERANLLCKTFIVNFSKWVDHI